MKPRLTLLLAILLVFVYGAARAQGLRAATGVARGSGNASQPGSVSGSRVSQGSRFFSAPSSSQATQNLSAQAATEVIVPAGVELRTNQNAVGAPRREFRSRTPVVFFEVAPVRVHRHFRFPRHPGILIIEVPHVVGTSVTTRLVPSGGWVEPRMLEEPPADSRLRSPGQLAPFDPTPQEVVERMLALAGVKRGDVLYDLGSGDGRIVIAAAKKYGARAVGFEIEPGLVKLARENARAQGVEKLVEIRQQDILTADLSPASVVTLYLSYDGNLAVRPQLMKQLKPGARVVSHAFDMGDWQPKIVETYRDAAGDTHALYYWEIGGPLAFSNVR